MTIAAEWQGQVGAVWAAEWRRTDRSFAGLSVELDAAILAAAPAGPGSALDIGCGAGATSIALAAARPDIAVTGIDIAADLVAVARGRAAHLANTRFVVADVAAVLPDQPPLDLLASRHGVMFFADPVAAFARLRAAASPGAALVFSCFRAPSLNPWAIDLAARLTGEPPTPSPAYAPGPFAFADPSFVAATLAAAGWCDAVPTAVDYAYVAGAGDGAVADALGFFRRVGPVASALRTAPDARRAAMLDTLAVLLQEYRRDGAVTFPAAAWIWRARAGERP